MPRLLLSCLLSVTTALAYAQDYNLQLLANVDFIAGSNEEGNDVWGYVDSTGLEYAIMGSTAATYIYSLENPSAPALRARIKGPNSPWRDIKSYGTKVYVVADRDTAGLVVVDMAHAPDSISSTNYKPQIVLDGSTTRLEKSHNLYITQEGLLVLAGSNVDRGRPLFFDLTQDESEPPFVGASRRVYAHDVFAENGRLYSSDIYTGEVTIHDYTDPSDIVALGSASTTTNFTHNAWPTADDASVFTTDEKAGAFVDAFDVRAAADIRFLDKFRPDGNLGSGSIPHNTHVLGDYLITSWYRDGIILTDVSRPNNMVEVGRYDTYPRGGGDGFDGNWGAYPFLPSGLVLASDIQRGLFVFKPNYERGCYFEGTVTDSLSGLPLSGVTVDFDRRASQSTTTDISGNYATGIYAEGTYPVTFSKDGYATRTITTSLARGAVALQDIKLRPRSSVNLTVNVTGPQGEALPQAQFIIEYIGEAGLIGDAPTQLKGTGGTAMKLATGRYDVIVGAWGYQTKLLSDLEFANNEDASLTVKLQRGVYDDFLFDFGWEVSATANTGLWERALPTATFFSGAEAQLGADVRFDFGGEAFATGNGSTTAAGDDVDAGTVTLSSPYFDGTILAEGASVEFWYHFFNEGGESTPNDQLVATLTNGAGEDVELLKVTSSTSDWTKFRSQRLDQLITLTDSMRIMFATGDAPSSGHLVEAMIDAVSIAVVSAEQPTLETAGLIELCAPANLSVTAQPEFVNANSRWTLPGATIEEQTGPEITASYSRGGTYSIYLTLVDSTNGSSSYFFEDAISVSPKTDASFSFEYVGDTIFFSNNSIGALTTSWDFGDGTTSSDEFTAHSYADIGDYEVTLIVEGECGRDTTSQTLTVFATSSVANVAGPAGLTVITNPVTDQLNLEYTGLPEKNLVLLNAVGTPVQNITFGGPALLSVDVSRLPAGNYFLRALGESAAAIPILIAR